jgi:maltooligosyltrehalose synthase
LDPWCNLLPDYVVVVDSDNRRVVAGAAVKKAQAKVQRKHGMQIRHWMEIWTKDGPQNIPAERFKHQEQVTKNGHRPVTIYAFKAHQARYYGFSCEFDGKTTFFVTAIDPAKKDDKADPEMIARAGREAFQVLEKLGIK